MKTNKQSIKRETVELLPTGLRKHTACGFRQGTFY